MSFERTNQFLFEIERAKILEFTFEGDVQFNDNSEPTLKIQLLLEQTGPESKGDLLTVSFFGKAADIVDGLKEGDYITCKCKAKSRFLNAKDGSEFAVTDIVCYFVSEYEEKQRETRSRRGEETQRGKREAADSGRTGNQRTRRPERR